MIAFPNCKINLGLNIVSKRSDGYHNIETCFYPIPWCEPLEVTIANSFEFTSSGTPIPGGSKDNLVVRVYELLKADFELPPIKIHLMKCLPMGAGLGGGSADGAFMLKLLNEKFELGLKDDQLESYALQLGSDCPFFIRNRPMIAKGRGNEFEEIGLSLANKHLVLVHPGIHVSTKDAYAGVNPKQPQHDLREILSKVDPNDWQKFLVNDFEKSVFKLYPEIERIKIQLLEAGAMYASMSGSGSAVYGVFKSKVESSFPKNYLVKRLSL